MARELKTWARFGPPMGRTWEPTSGERKSDHEVRPLVPNDWTLVGAEVPSAAEGKTFAIDLASSTAKKDRAAEGESGTVRTRLSTLPAAWHGTLLPGGGGDTWLAAAFADYETIVAREQVMRAHAKEQDRKLKPAEEERLDLAMFAPRSRYEGAVKRLGRDVPLASIEPDVERSEWYEIAAGKGVLLLSALREKLGDDVFLKLMDDFGRSHAGQPASAEAFRTQAEKAGAENGRDLTGFFDSWLKGQGLPDAAARPVTSSASVWSIDSFEVEPEAALIVYGTLKEADAQREAAEHLQRAIARRWSNILVPVRADTEIAEADLRSHHVLVVGRPDTIYGADRLVKTLPVTFGPASFVLKGETYAHPATALIVAGPNPFAIALRGRPVRGPERRRHLADRPARWGPQEHAGARLAVGFGDEGSGAGALKPEARGRDPVAMIRAPQPEPPGSPDGAFRGELARRLSHRAGSPVAGVRRRPSRGRRRGC